MKSSNKVAFITGAGSEKGIGKGIADSFAEKGINLAINYRSRPEEAEIIANNLSEKGVEVLLLKGDLTNVEEISDMFKKVMEHFGRLDILVNNAGACVWEDVGNVTQSGFETIVNVNLKATFECSRIAANIMSKSINPGRIINVSSVQAKRPTPSMAVYSATKSAIDNFTQTLALELASYQITVNQLWPGFVDTNINNAKPELSNNEERNKWIETIPLEQIVTPWDMGEAAYYLCSEAGRAITGATIKVDGGAFIRVLQ